MSYMTRNMFYHPRFGDTFVLLEKVENEKIFSGFN